MVEGRLWPAKPADSSLEKLRPEVRALEQLSGTQDASIAQLPGSTRAFCESKGRLYAVIKGIISAGQALHAADPEAASKYNSKLLYRRIGKAKVEAEGTGTAGTTEKK